MSVVAERAAVSTGDRELPDKRLKVLHLIDSLGIGGAERVLVDLSRRLLERGVDVRVVAMRSRDGNPLAASLRGLGIDVPQLEVKRLRDPEAYRRVRCAIAQCAPDVVHTHLECSNVLGTLASHRLGVPTVATLHTDMPPLRSRAGLRGRLAAYMLRRYAARVYLVSRSARHHHLRFSRLRPETAIVVNNGIDVEKYARCPPAARKELRAEFGVSSDAPLILTVAVQRREKGIDCMIAALPHIRRRVPDAVYLLVGTGPSRGDLERQAQQLGLGPSVCFAGARSDIERFLAAADVFVLPSLKDPLPTAVAEAMASGLPIIASDVDGISEMIEHDKTGLLVRAGHVAALAEAVTSLLKDRNKALGLGRVAREVACARFDDRFFAARLHAEYLGVIANASTGSR
jgi:glycosyltransferase involved in cell wall biosynthesis